MRVVVLSDTHMQRAAKVLPAVVLREIERCDLVIHLGDFTEMEVVHALQSLAPLLAVHGNNDCREIQARFAASETVTLGCHSATAIHGHLGGRTALHAARQVVDSDIVLYGHDHSAYCAYEAGTLLFNPGSPTDRRWGRSPTFGILSVDEVIEPRIINLGQ